MTKCSVTDKAETVISIDLKYKLLLWHYRTQHLSSMLHCAGQNIWLLIHNNITRTYIPLKQQ